MAEHHAKKWPEFPANPIPIPRLGPNPSPIELAKALASLAIAYNDQLMNVVRALSILREDLTAARSEAAAARDASGEARSLLGSLKESIDALVKMLSPETFAQRGQQVSSNDLERFAQRVEKKADQIAEAAEEVKEAAEEITSPGTIPHGYHGSESRDSRHDSDRVQKQIEKGVEQGIKLYKGELAEKQINDQKKIRNQAIAGIIVGIVLAFLAYLAGRAGK